MRHVTANGLPLAPQTDAAWKAMAAHIDDTRLRDARFESIHCVKRTEPSSDASIAGWCGRKDASEAEKMLCTLGIAAARLVQLSELYSRPDP